MRKVAAALFVLLLGAPAAYAATELDKSAIAVGNHTTFVEILLQEEERVPGHEYAAIAGIVACRPANPIGNAVLWFNDKLLFQAPGPRAPDTRCVIERDTHVYAVAEGAPDPRNNPSLTPTGDVFEFTDPNGVDWTVVEYAYFELTIERRESTSVVAGPITASLDAELHTRLIKRLTWVVRVDEPTFDPTIGDFYNFVVLLNFTKMDRVMRESIEHDGQAGDVRGGNSHDAAREDEEHRFPHRHDQVQVHLYTGAAPAPSEGPADPGIRTRVRGEVAAGAFGAVV